MSHQYVWFFRASQSNKIMDISKPITTQTDTNSAPHVDEGNINSVTINSNNSGVDSSSNTNNIHREAYGIVEDLSSLTINSNSETSITASTTGANSGLSGDVKRTDQSKRSDATTVLHKCPSDDGNRAIGDSVSVLERHTSDDSNNLTHTKCSHQQQNHSKENATLPHKGQSKSGGKGSKKSKDKKNSNTSHEKLKHSGGGGRNVTSDNPSSNASNKVENTPTKPSKENVTKGHTNVKDNQNKKKKNKDNVAPVEEPEAHEELTTAKSESNCGMEHRSSSTGVKAPPPGLTKQPSHTNAVNGK